MRVYVVALVALLLGGLASSASALTVPQAVGIAGEHTVQHVDYKKKKKYYHKRRHYRPGGHYDRAPSHWHRYHKRPGDWQRRGCIIVGPIWWCP